MAGSETSEVIYELEQKFSVTLHNMPERYGIGYAVVRKESWLALLMSG